MPSKKEKHHQQQVLTNTKTQTTPLANSTNTTPTNQTYHSITTNHHTILTTKKTNLNNDHSSLMRDQKHELDQLNNRFSNYVDALRKKTAENNDLQKKVDTEKQKQKTLTNRDTNDLETKMDEVRNEMDESAVLTEHFRLKHTRALKELNLLKEKIRQEDDPSYSNRRQLLETEYQQTLIQLNELKRRYEDLENFKKTNQQEFNQMNDLYNKLEDELHDLLLNNNRLECNLKTIEEKILLTKAIYETEKADLVNEQIKQQQFYTNELDQAINDIKQDFQILLKNNKVILENAYTERIEQMKTQIITYENTKQQENSLQTKLSIETLHTDMKDIENEREQIENEYRLLFESYLSKQKEKNQFQDEHIRLNTEYSRLINEINTITEQIEIGKQYWFSVHFELETYRRLLDLETIKVTNINKNIINHSTLSNGKQVNGVNESPQPEQQQQQQQQQEPQQIITVKKTDTQRSISKTGKFDIDQVTAGFISINNAATNCIDQALKGWRLVRTLNDSEESVYQFPDNYILKARTRVRVYSNKVENTSSVQGRLIASSVPSWASTNQGDNVKIVLLDEKDINRAQYSETWQ